MNIKSEMTKSDLIKKVVEDYFSNSIFEIVEGCADRLQKELNEHLNFETLVKFDFDSLQSGTSDFNVYFGEETDRKVISFSVYAKVKSSSSYSAINNINK